MSFLPDLFLHAYKPTQHLSLYKESPWQGLCSPEHRALSPVNGKKRTSVLGCLGGRHWIIHVPQQFLAQGRPEAPESQASDFLFSRLCNVSAWISSSHLILQMVWETVGKVGLGASLNYPVEQTHPLGTFVPVWRLGRQQRGRGEVSPSLTCPSIPT